TSRGFYFYVRHWHIRTPRTVRDQRQRNYRRLQQLSLLLQCRGTFFLPGKFTLETFLRSPEAVYVDQARHNNHRKGNVHSIVFEMRVPRGRLGISLVPYMRKKMESFGTKTKCNELHETKLFFPLRSLQKILFHCIFVSGIKRTIKVVLDNFIFDRIDDVGH